MIRDVGEEFRNVLKGKFTPQLELLPRILALFGSGAASTALGALAEKLVMEITGATEPSKRNNKGFDLVRGEETIEVKSRDLAHWGESVKFDLRQTSSETTTAYYVVWDWEDGRPVIRHAFVSSINYLKSKWPGQKPYCMRTNLRNLMSDVAGIRAHP